MKRFLLLFAGLCLSPGLWAATTYTYTGHLFTSFSDFNAPCVNGPCADYPPVAMVTGSFTTVAPLPANLVQANVYPSVTSYSFTDGINTYSSTDPNARVYDLLVGTDANGNVSFVQLDVDLWRSGSSPHGLHDAVSYLAVYSSAGVDRAYNNAYCVQIGVSPAGVPDTCLGASSDSSSSAGVGTSGTWSRYTYAVTPSVGLWWNPNESGSGYNIDIKHGVLVLTVYSYKPNGDSEWYIASGPMTNDGRSFTGILGKARYGQCISCAYPGVLPVSGGNDGPVTINFSSATAAVMYLPGERVIDIQPQPF